MSVSRKNFSKKQNLFLFCLGKKFHRFRFLPFSTLDRNKISKWFHGFTFPATPFLLSLNHISFFFFRYIFRFSKKKKKQVDAYQKKKKKQDRISAIVNNVWIAIDYDSYLADTPVGGFFFGFWVSRNVGVTDHRLDCKKNGCRGFGLLNLVWSHRYCR